MKSKYVFEKVFDWEFEREHYSFFTVHYRDDFNEGFDEAFDSTWEFAYLSPQFMT